MLMSKTFKQLSLIVVILMFVVAPVSAQWSGTWVSSFQIMNLGTDYANIMVEWYKEDGTKVLIKNYQIAVGSSLNLYQPAIPDLPGSYKGSVIVNADQPIAAVASEQITYSDGSIGSSQYSGFSAETIGNKFYLPNVNKKFGAGQWSSRITIQNVNANPITVTITFYNSDASIRDTDVLNLPGNGSVSLMQINDTELPEGWLGSAIVEATGNIAVIVDVMSADGRLETYNGFTSGATTMYLPTILIGFGANQWNTSFQVFNVGGATAVVTMTYYTAGIATPAKVVTDTLSPYRSINRYQPNVDPDLGVPWIGSVVIESTQPIVAVGTQTSGRPGTKLASAYNGFARGATTAFLPTVLRFFGGGRYVTSFQIMNVGMEDASVIVEYFTPGNSTPVQIIRYDGVENPKIKPYTSVNRYQGADIFLGDNWQGSVRVTSDQPIVVLGSQNGTARTGDAAGQYNGILGP